MQIETAPRANGLARSPAPERTPDVSFIVAAMNVAPFIEQAVASALAQTGVAVEVVVADDASSDATADAMEALANRDPRVTLIRLPQRGGPSAARNAAMARAAGTWMAILDGDDFILPGRSRCLLDLAAATSADLVADNFERVDIDGRPLGLTLLPVTARPYSFLVDTARFIRGNVTFSTRGRMLGAVKAMFRTEFIRQHSLRHREDLSMGEDYMFILSCLLAGGRFAVSSQSHYNYRQRPGSQSWRLSEDHIDRLLAAHEDMVLHAQSTESNDIGAAARRYAQALENARDFTRTFANVKAGAWLRALGIAAPRPGVWPLLGRFGTEAIAKRLRRRS